MKRGCFLLIRGKKYFEIGKAKTSKFYFQKFQMHIQAIGGNKMTEEWIILILWASYWYWLMDECDLEAGQKERIRFREIFQLNVRTWILHDSKSRKTQAIFQKMPKKTQFIWIKWINIFQSTNRRFCRQKIILIAVNFMMLTNAFVFSHACVYAFANEMMKRSIKLKWERDQLYSMNVKCWIFFCKCI